MKQDLKKKKGAITMFRSGEDVISMVLGLVVVVIISLLLVNFIRHAKGTISVPGLTTNIWQETKVKGNETNVEIKKEEIKNNGYVVASGDSLWKIALRSYGDGNKWVEIAKANGLTNPRVIAVGQKLDLPEISKAEKIVVREDTVKAVSPEKVVTVKGDSLWKIAVKIYGDGFKWVRIWEANKARITDPNLIATGMVIALPMLK